MKKFEYYQKILIKNLEQKHYKQLRCVIPIDEIYLLSQDRKYLNFSSNDYLGLSKHAYLKKNVIKFVLQWGAGSTASRLMTEHLLCHKTLEEKLSKLLGFETALLFNSGFQANSTILSCLAGPQSFIFLDRLCHNSLLQGALNNRSKVYRYNHNDLSHLRRLLEKTAKMSCNSKIIVSESVFTMEGDECDLKGLIALAEEFDCLLYIDDAHAVGVFGKRGMGLCAHRKGIDIVVGSFGKACGSFGAYVGCSELIRDYIINFCSGFIQMTTLPPAILGAIDAALDLIPNMESERKKLLQKSGLLRNELKRLGFPLGNASTHIIPLILGSSEETLNLSDWLASQEIIAPSIRPPFVPPGTSRIRIALSALHESKHTLNLIEKLRSWRKDSTCEMI